MEALRRGIVHGTAGNFSERDRETGLIAISPSGIPYPDTTIEDVVVVDDHGNVVEGHRRPSSETPMHTMVMRVFDQIDAIVHTHSTYCTSLSIARKPIPPIHYMIAHFGGPDIRCADYALYGSAELSAHVLDAMEGRNGCLLANHGMIAAGKNLAQAMWLAVELETLARQYWHALQIGGPVLLSAEEVRQAAEKFGVTGYGLAG